MIRSLLNNSESAKNVLPFGTNVLKRYPIFSVENFRKTSKSDQNVLEQVLAIMQKFIDF